MKQIFQTLGSGATELGEVPCPQVKQGSLLIQSKASVVSIGTERMVVEFGKASLISKAKQQPEKVKQVIEKVKTNGIMATVETVKAKLDQPIPLGYSNAGVVLKVGDGVTGFSIGDRVVSNGPHAEVVCVPKNLCAKIPDQVSDEEAAFTVITSIGLQGVRLIQPTLGERLVVTGLGLIGLLAVQILRAHGCRVLGIDFDENKLNLARSFGAETVNLTVGEDPVAAGINFSGGRGVDGVLITAATQSNEPVHQAAQMCRKRGRIVLVGVTGLDLLRSDFYEKELTFQVSCSYGPGRYDPDFEGKGVDYPIGFVRWTEQRNFEAALEMMADQRLRIQPLITHRVPFDRALEAYDLLCQSKSPLGILLNYPEQEKRSEKILNPKIILNTSSNHFETKTFPRPSVAMIGAGGFATQVLLPALKKSGVRLKTIASLSGLSGMNAGRRFGFETTTTDLNSIFDDQEIDTIFITTRHDNHAGLVCQALKAGKHVFVEKPLAIEREKLLQIKEVYQEAKNRGLLLMVGFNRRFAPQACKMKTLLGAAPDPKCFVITVNAGPIPAGHWTRDPGAGGGRIIGEACHFIDLLRFLTGSPVTNVLWSKTGGSGEESVSFTLNFADGSMGTVHYLTNGNKAFPKERIEAFCAGRILQLDNFKILRGFGWPGFRKMKLWKQDKGHANEVREFIEAVRDGKPPLIDFNELEEVTEFSFRIAGI